ncbi:hypothetical protein ACFX5D_08460 [Flavobacterium sp. LB3P45]|uniref:Uncharacterized protein n=1 Tax=Flavobacterium fructosi TaxID=3230416 RepID=A0ABW6HLS6_9FLAO
MHHFKDEFLMWRYELNLSKVWLAHLQFFNAATIAKKIYNEQVNQRVKTADFGQTWYIKVYRYLSEIKNTHIKKEMCV